MKANSPFKNVLAILFGRTGELILTFFAITLLVRYLGTSQYGIFTSSVATVTIFSKLLDLGFSQIVFREYSSDSDNFTYLNSAITIRIIILAIFILSFNIYSYVSYINPEEIIIINILSLNVIFSSRFRNIRDLLEIPFKTKMRMDIVMLCTFLDNILLLSFIIIGSYFNLSLILITLLYTVANLPGFIVLSFNSYKKNKFRFRIGLRKIKWLVIESLPLWGTGILLALFLQLDVVLIKNFISNEAAGLYSASLRVGIPLQVIPLSIITTIFPVLVQKKDKEIRSAQEIIDFSLKTLVLLLIFFSLIVSFKADEILNILYGEEFVVVADTLSLLIWSFTFYYINQLSQNLTTVISEQQKSFYYSLILITVYLLVLLFTLNVYGIVGAGLARLISAIIGFIYFYFYLKKSKFTINFISKRNSIFFVFLLIGAYFLKEINVFLYSTILLLYTLLFMLIIKYYNEKDMMLLYRFLKEPKWMERYCKK